MRWRAITVFTAASAGLLCAATLTGAAPASGATRAVQPAASSGTWGGAEEVQGLPAFTGDDEGAEITQISCASTGNCSAIGDYWTDSSGDVLPFVVSEVNGTWGKASQISGLSALDATSVRLTSLSCASPGNCTAVGSYAGSGSDLVAVNETDGAWGSAEQIPLQSGLAAVSVVLNSVSCWSSESCVAGGSYETEVEGSNVYQTLVTGESGGSWTDAQQLSNSATLNTGDNATIESVSCSTGGDCAAGGSYSTSPGFTEALVATGSGGDWGDAEAVPGIIAMNVGESSVDSVSCAPSGGGCSAGGSYVNDSGTQAFVVTGSGSSWGEAEEVPGTAALNTGPYEGIGGVPDAMVQSVSCASAGDCSAGGFYTDTNDQSDGFLVNESGGTWGNAEEIPDATTLTSGGGSTDVASISCPSVGDCGAGGQYEDGAEGYAFSGFVENEVNGTWQDPEAVPGLESLNVGWSGETETISCAAAGSCAAGGTYTDGYNDNEAFVVDSTAAPSCDSATLDDGSYEVGGCFSEQDSGTLDVTDQQSNIDGIDVSASSGDQVSYDDGGSEGHAVTSAGDSTLSLDLDSTDIPFFTGQLDDLLTGPISVTVGDTEDSARMAAATTTVAVGGLPLSGKLTITPASGGKATGTASTTLPAVLGGGKATLTFTTTVNSGLSNVKVSVAKATFMQLFSLSKVTLTYDALNDTWSVSGTASSGGSTSAPFKGSLTYSDGTLSSASLSVGKISLAGLVDLSSLDVTYAGGNWSGDAALAQGGTAAISLSFSASTLTSGSIAATNVPLFGVLDVKKFALSYASGTWHLAVTTTLSGSGGGSAALTVTNGVVTAASLKLTNLSFLGKFTLAEAGISYAQDAPNDACKGVTGQEIWCGDWQVRLPQASVITGVSGTLATADGQFASGSIDVKGNVPLLDGIYLTKLGAVLTVNPSPVKISGDADLSFGPKINGKSLLSFGGTLTRTLPGDGTSGAYAADGTLNALNKLKGTVKINVPGDDAATSIDLTASVSLSKASASGKLTGSFTADSFSMTGKVTITVLGTTITGTMAADNHGMAACGTYKGHEAGFEFIWATQDVSFHGKSGCTEAGF
jgi:hypothetical protein